MKSFVTCLGPPKEEAKPVIRELLAYEAYCETSNPLPRDKDGYFRQPLTPSPLYWSRQGEWPWALQQLDPKPNQTLLDVGSGWSVLQYALARRCHKLITMDPDPEAGPRARQTALQLGIHNIQSVRRGLPKLVGPSDYYDSVSCISVLEHLEDVDLLACLHELLRVLKPSGKLVLTCDVVIDGEQPDYHLHWKGFLDLLQKLGAHYLDADYPCMCGRGTDGLVFLIAGMLIVKGQPWQAEPTTPHGVDLHNPLELDKFVSKRK